VSDPRYLLRALSWVIPDRLTSLLAEQQEDRLAAFNSFTQLLNMFYFQKRPVEVEYNRIFAPMGATQSPISSQVFYPSSITGLLVLFLIILRPVECPLLPALCLLSWQSIDGRLRSNSRLTLFRDGKSRLHSIKLFIPPSKAKEKDQISERLPCPKSTPRSDEKRRSL
ncbi:H(+)-transporting two-sector ATPase, partial [Striga asiatica]